MSEAVNVAAMEYVYKAKAVEKVTDGDTYWLHLDVGFRQSQLTNIRLHGFDCPERHKGSDFERAEAARALELADQWIRECVAVQDLWVKTQPDPDNFGRWLADVWCTAPGGGADYLGEHLRENRLAARWPTRWRDEFEATPYGLRAWRARRGRRASQRTAPKQARRR